MTLTNAQYDSIMRSYEQTQFKNRQILSSRREEVYAAIPEYQEIENSISSLCVAQGKKMLMGDTGALKEMKENLDILSHKKSQLLLSHGFETNYLEPVYDCKVCKDTGYVGNEKCSCFKQRIIDFLYQQSNISDLLQKENFSTLSYEYYEGEDLTRFESAVKASKKFIQDFKFDYQNLFFYGTVGTGKSFLSGCIARELLDLGHSVIYFSAAGLFDLLAKATFETGSKDKLARLQQDLTQCELLIIDDLGTEMTNSFVASSLFSILNERHLASHATIISTNLSLEELRDRYSDRTFSRISSNFKLFKLSGRDIRMHKKRFAHRK